MGKSEHLRGGERHEGKNYERKELTNETSVEACLRTYCHVTSRMIILHRTVRSKYMAGCQSLGRRTSPLRYQS